MESERTRRIEELERERDTYAKALSEANAAFWQKVKEFSIIKRMGDLVRWNLDKKSTCVEIVNIIIDETDAENCSLWLVDPSRCRLELVAARGQSDSGANYYPPGSRDARHLAMGEGAAGWVAANGAPLLMKDASKNKRFIRIESEIASSIKSLLCLPIVSKDGVIGVVNMSHPDMGVFSKENERSLGLITTQAAMAFSNLFLFERIQSFNEKLERRTEELQLAQENLVRAGKMAAIGEIASGVAHEINNPIAVIRGYAEDLMDKARAADGEPIKSEDLLWNLSIITGQAERCKEITSSLLNFTRNREVTLSTCDLVQLVRQAMHFVSHRFENKKIEMARSFPDDPIAVRTDQGMLEQVLLNIYNNAVDAIEKSGVIKTEITSRDGLVSIRISDSGSGISQENLPKIFHPFFTTRPVGKGTGLGLSICHQLAERLRGKILVESQPGHGSVFTIVIPEDFSSAEFAKGKGEDGEAEDTLAGR